MPPTSSSDAISAQASDSIDVFETAPDGIVVVDETGEITAANIQLATMFGYDTGRVGGPTGRDVVAGTVRTTPRRTS